MLRYKLRTLLILLAIGPPLLAGAWFGYQRVAERRVIPDIEEFLDLIQTTVEPNPWDHAGEPGSLDEFSEEFIVAPAREQEPGSP